MRIGYGRVSTRDQNPDAQEDALTAANCDRIFVDKASGKLASRPELDKALIAARDGRRVRHHQARPARPLPEEPHRAVRAAARPEGRQPRRLDQGIDTSTPAGRMFFQILGAIAEFEHAMIVERTHDGLAAARARGRVGGRKQALKPRQVQLAQEMYDELGGDGKRKHTVQDIADELGVARTTIYRYLERKEA
jgi:DNA invertase Pin-like site-specific DNA recombinase